MICAKGFTVHNSNLNRLERYHILQSRSLAPLDSSEATFPRKCNLSICCSSIRGCDSEHTPPLDMGLPKSARFNLVFLPEDLLLRILSHLSFTDRSGLTLAIESLPSFSAPPESCSFADCRLCNIPLVCKTWAVLSRGSSSLWSSCDVGPDAEAFVDGDASTRDARRLDYFQVGYLATCRG